MGINAANFVQICLKTNSQTGKAAKSVVSFKPLYRSGICNTGIEKHIDVEIEG